MNEEKKRCLYKKQLAGKQDNEKGKLKKYPKKSGPFF